MKRVIEDHGFPERRACRLIGVDRTAFQYQRSCKGDATVRARMRELANERRRFGYRRLAIMLKREGLAMNLKKVYRLYKEERLTVRKRGGRKRRQRKCDARRERARQQAIEGAAPDL